MSSALERRLEQVQDAGLTARERARLFCRATLAGEEPDERLQKYMPPEQRQEFDRLVSVIHDAADYAYQTIARWNEWTTTLEQQLGWLETLVAYQGRERELMKLATGRAKKPSNLSPLPPPKRSVERILPAIGAEQVGEAETVPETWEGMREQLSNQVRFNVELRWKELLAFEELFAGLDREWGENAVHYQVREGFDALREALLAIHRDHQAVAGTWELPGLDAALVERHWPSLRWDDLRDAPTSDPRRRDPRQSLYGAQREELAEQEAAWAASVR